LTSDAPTEFEAWLADAFAATGAFTALIVLVRIGDTHVAPLCSTYVNVIGPEVSWNDMVVMLAGAGQQWDGVAFFPEQERGRPLDNPTARTRLRLLEQRLDDDRLVLNEGHFFDRWGRRMRIDEIDPP
jgi:hypothetical protein